MIEGSKTVMRQLEVGDEKYLHKWRNDNKGNLYCGFKYGFLISEEAFKNQLKKDIESQEVFPKEKMFIISTKDNNKLIGEISYRNWNKRNRSAEFGIEIGEIEYRGKGYGSDALKNFLDFMFKHLNLNRIELTTLIDNKNAISLYKKLGFKEIGIIREQSFDSRTGEYTDVMYMDLLKKEWLNNID